jgi:hypothetical protein
MVVFFIYTVYMRIVTKIPENYEKTYCKYDVLMTTQTICAI